MKKNPQNENEKYRFFFEKSSFFLKKLFWVWVSLSAKN